MGKSFSNYVQEKTATLLKERSISASGNEILANHLLQEAINQGLHKSLYISLLQFFKQEDIFSLLVFNSMYEKKKLTLVGYQEALTGKTVGWSLSSIQGIDILVKEKNVMDQGKIYTIALPESLYLKVIIDQKIGYGSGKYLRDVHLGVLETSLQKKVINYTLTKSEEEDEAIGQVIDEILNMLLNEKSLHQ